MKLTKMQRELLELLADGDRFGISDARIARALERKGFAKFFAHERACTITKAGRMALEEATA